MEVQATGTVIGQPAYGHAGYVAAAAGPRAFGDSLLSPSAGLLLTGLMLASYSLRRRTNQPVSRPRLAAWLIVAVALVVGGLVTGWQRYDERLEWHTDAINERYLPREP